jgi:hypothetical protein
MLIPSTFYFITDFHYEWMPMLRVVHHDDEKSPRTSKTQDEICEKPLGQVPRGSHGFRVPREDLRKADDDL